MTQVRLRRSLLPCALFLLLALLVPISAAAGSITDWNQQLLDSIRAGKTNPPFATRQLALLHTSQYDAVIGILGGYERYHATGNPAAGASAEAAAEAAGYQILSALYPSRQAFFDDLYQSSVGALPDGQAKNDGIAWGAEVAQQILALRQNDGSTNTVTYNPPLGATWWVRTPPAFAPPLLPQWPYVQPWTLERGNQLRSPGQPVSPTSDAYLKPWVEVYLLGDVDSAVRTADQSEIAVFWNDGAGTQTPPGHWMSIAQGVAQQYNLDLRDSARLFALLSLTVADAAIVSWDNKYHFHNWRPVTAIHNADLDGNPHTFQDKTWSSFITTPPFPTYTSGHSTFSGSSAELLRRFLGTDNYAFSIGSDGTPGVTRSFQTLSQAAAEAGQSRIYGGIHWQYDNTDGLAGGRALAGYVYANFLRPIGQTHTCQASEYSLCLLNRFAVEVDFRSEAGATPGRAKAVPSAGYDGRFYFFNEENTELMVKVLDGCTLGNHYWVFSGGATDVEYILRVTDTNSNITKTYYNPLGHPAAAITDTEAFATCP